MSRPEHQSNIIIRSEANGGVGRINLSTSYESLLMLLDNEHADWFRVVDIYGRRQAWRRSEIVGIEAAE